MGRCLSALLCGHCDLTVCSREPEKARHLARKLGAKGAGYEGCEGKDIVFLAVRTQDLAETARKVAVHMAIDSLLVDLSSVKCGVVEEVQGALPNCIYYISIHPLFSSQRIKVKNTIVVPIRAGSWMGHLRRLLEMAGMSIKETSAEEHDRAMAIVQATHHFALLSLGATLRQADFNGFEGLKPFMTHSMTKTLGAMRLVERNLDTIEMIQEKNKYSEYARRRFIEEAKRLDKRYSTGTR